MLNHKPEDPEVPNPYGFSPEYVKDDGTRSDELRYLIGKPRRIVLRWRLYNVES